MSFFFDFGDVTPKIEVSLSLHLCGTVRNFWMTEKKRIFELIRWDKPLKVRHLLPGTAGGPKSPVVSVGAHLCHGQKSRFLGDGRPPSFNRNPYNGYIYLYYWVDDHPLVYGNNGSLDPGTFHSTYSGVK